VLGLTFEESFLDKPMWPGMTQAWSFESPPKNHLPPVGLSASLQCKRENATAVHKNPWPWAMAIFMRLNIFITKIALRGGCLFCCWQVFRCH